MKSTVIYSTYKLPTSWAPYLINGDSSGLSDDDIAECDKHTAGMGYCVDVSEGSEFMPYRGLGRDVSEYTFGVERTTDET